MNEWKSCRDKGGGVSWGGVNAGRTSAWGSVFLMGVVAFLSSFPWPKTTRLTVLEELFTNVC